MQKIVLLAVLVILASAFTPLANLKCDAANTGTKTRSYETTSTPSDDVDWVTVGEHYGPGTNAGTTTSTNVYLMKKGNEATSNHFNHRQQVGDESVDARDNGSEPRFRDRFERRKPVVELRRGRCGGNGVRR